jgi:hypothetical protein
MSSIVQDAVREDHADEGNASMMRMRSMSGKRIRRTMKSKSRTVYS